MHFNIGCDLDGVLVDFNRGYRGALIKASGRNLFNNETDPPCWHYAPACGYTKDEDKAAWDYIRSSPDFWLRLASLPGSGDFLWALDCAVQLGPTKPRVYFITSRPGLDVKRQSEEWLAKMGVLNPTVLIVGDERDKGLVASGLNLTHFIDDKPENCLAVKATRQNGCVVYCPPRRYNTPEQPWLKVKGVVIGDLASFARACGLTYPNRAAA